MKKILVFTAISLLPVLLSGQNELIINLESNSHQVQLTNSGEVLLRSPSEGLWQISTSWNKDWPDIWTGIQADSLENINGFQILHGSAKLNNGVFKVRDAYSNSGGRIKCTRRWEWHGKDTLKQVTLTAFFATPVLNNKIVIPGVLYFGNPAGARSGNTPVLEGTSGEIALFEEHRLPMPFVSQEWGSEKESSAVALHSIPSPVPFGHKIDQWWSLGIQTLKDQTNLCLYSGPCGFNGSKSVIKAFQGSDMAEEYNDAWINMPPNTIIEKTFYLDSQMGIEEGSGFQGAVEASMDIFKPWDLSSFPSYDEILQSKLKFSESRYYEKGSVTGFRKYPDRDFFVLGWCGQAMTPGYAYQILGNKYSISDHLTKVQKSLDFLSSVPFYEHGFYTWYNTSKGEWFMNHTPEWLSQGQAMLNIANAIIAAKKSELNTSEWINFLIKASDYHSKRILETTWNPESTNEGFFIAPLVLASKILKNDQYLSAARKAAAYYANLYLHMKEVYWGGTLDASCEDKEGAFAALQGFMELYDHTGEPQYLIWAKHAGDVCLTYTVVWDIPLPPGRLTDHNFKTRGWTAVSVQNMHIDVYGVLIAPYIYRLGIALDKSSYLKTAELMFRSCGQLLDPYGSQGEQPYQTNYIQTNWRDKPVYERRGNYLETWTVFWITAHFLNAGAMLSELGAI